MSIPSVRASSGPMRSEGRLSSFVPTVSAVWSVIGTAPVGGTGPTRIISTVTRCVMAAAVIVAAASFRHCHPRP